MDAPPHPNRNLWPRNLAGRTSVVGCHGVGMTSVVGCHGVDQVKTPSLMEHYFQVKRRQWKMKLIEDLRRLTTSEPIPLPIE